MPLDHYVPQVHLRKFDSPVLQGQMFAIRKSDLAKFKPRSQDVCRIEDGSTNAYLREDRLIEEFLKTIEPKYTSAIERIRKHALDDEVIYVIAGFVAYVMSCSPAGMRINSELPRKTVELTARTLDAAGEMPMPPKALGGESLTELLNAGKIKVTVDPKYPQAIGIANILRATKMLGNFAWEVVVNPYDDSPYFTSDFPVAIERSEDIRVLNRLIPLSPDLAIRIRPDVNLRRDDCDFAFSKFRYHVSTGSRKDVAYLNTAFVRCAESVVFYRDELPWVEHFVTRNRRFRIEPKVHEIPNGTGAMLIATQRIVANP